MGKLYLAIAFILAGSSVVSASFVSEQLPVFTTTALSLMFAAATAVLLCGKKMYTTAKLLTGRIWRAIALQALFGCFLFRVFLTSGLQYIGAAEAGIITGVTPAITALFAWIMLREMLNVQIILGIAIAVAGILMVQGYPFAVVGTLQPLGVIFVLCAAACEAFFTTLSRKVSLNEVGLPPLVHAGFVSLFALVLCAIPAGFEQSWQSVVGLSIGGWLALLWYGSIVTVIAFAFMFAGAKQCSGYTIAAYAGIIPASSTLLSVILLKETVSVYQVVGCGLVVLATLIISKQKK